MERHLLALVHLDFPLLPIDNPVLVDPTARVEFQLDLAVTTLLSTARRQDLHDQLGCRMEMSRLVQGAGQTLTADPDHIRRHIVIIGKDHARRLQRDPQRGLITPDYEGAAELSTSILMMITRLPRHVEVSINNLIALVIVVQDL